MARELNDIIAVIIFNLYMRRVKTDAMRELISVL
jgi:hypothetical protein